MQTPEGRDPKVPIHDRQGINATHHWEDWSKRLSAVVEIQAEESKPLEWGEHQMIWRGIKRQLCQGPQKFQESFVVVENGLSRMPFY